MKRIPQSKAAIPYVVLAALLLGLLAPAMLLPHSAVAIEVETPTGCTPGDKECEALMKEVQTARGLEKTARTPTQITPQECSVLEISCGILLVLNWLVDMVIFIVYPLLESTFNALLAVNFEAFGDQSSRFLVASQAGWKIMLGIVNMFFVLLLLWIAIATIFSFEMFSARRLLPQLIIIALLINFSFAIGKAIINLSNGIGAIFANQIQERFRGVANAVSQISDPRAITQALQNNYSSLSPEEAKKALQNITTTIQPGFSILGIINIPTGSQTTYNAEQCYTLVNDPLLGWYIPRSLGGLKGDWTYWKCNALLADTEVSRALAAYDPTYGKLTLLAGAFVAKAFVAPIALFILFAGSIFLLVRVIALMGLLIFAPIAFFGSIVPGMQGYWSAWWQKLFKWSFFLPAFLFLFMLSLLVFQAIPTNTLELIRDGKAVPDLSLLLVQYFIGIGLMIFALLMGNQMSIYGANTVTGWGKKMSKGIGGWTKNRGWKYGGRAAGAAMGTRLGAAAARIPVLGAGVRAGAAAVIKKGAGVEKKDIDFYAKLSNRELARQFGSRAIPPHLRQAIYRSFNNTRKREFAIEAQRQNINLQDLVGTATRRQQAFPQIFGQPPPVTAPPPPTAAPPAQTAEELREQIEAVERDLEEEREERRRGGGGGGG